jgi:hypothetical protein
MVSVIQPISISSAATDPTYSTDNPKRGGSGSGQSFADFSLNISCDTQMPFRGQDVYLMISFKNKELLNCLTVQYINLNLGKIYNTSTGKRSVQIPKFKVDKNSSKIFKFKIHIPNDIDLNKKTIIDKDLNHKDDVIKIKNHRINGDKIIYSDNIAIQNNPPIIDSQIVVLNSSNILKLDDSDTLYLLGDPLKPVEAFFTILAHDTEDGKNLQYSAFLSSTSNCGYEIDNRSSFYSFESIGNFSKIIRGIQIGEQYILGVKVKDSDNAINKTNAFISYKDDIYKYFSIPSAYYLELTAIGFAMICTFLIIVFIYIRLRSYSNPIFTATSAIIIILLLIFVYIMLLLNSPVWVPGLNDYIFFNTLPIYELVIYLIFFVIINYFIELCFSLDDDRKLISASLWLNYLSTFIILIVFMFVLPKIPDISNILTSYYITIAGILGTIFALIVTLSSQFPKNIFTVTPLCKEKNKCHEPTTDLFSYPKKLQYFVMLYGSGLGISIFGIVIGTHIKFNTLIMEPFDENLINLISLSTFEITFLLIPLTIISLYNLMQVISFRGKITIKSRPCGAEIYLSRRLNEQESQTCDELELHDLKLLTPCTLMLRNGRYKLQLKYNSFKIVETIEIRNGEENNYLFELLDLDEEYRA